ncbi:aminoglycoside phosphotransferase family protein [Streptomyces jumonjinensis]|uniref:aminoglycoside phosphotransferase family protein n=1 Tax=Streptomyces jumonjinensis TaxID=1945 RepID=UPI0037BD7448
MSIEDPAAVARLVTAQFPRWAGLPVTAVDSDGTDHVMHRLGADMVVRLPRGDWATAQVEKEQRWLPRLAPGLPLAVPVPLALGAPVADCPRPWSVYRWLDGRNATVERLADPDLTAIQLAGFLGGLRRIDAGDGPPPGPHNGRRGEPLERRDRITREAIGALRGIVDAEAATAVWDAALRAPVWQGPPVWVHGDLRTGNLLETGGRLSAVIDFGCLAVGDPACDLAVAWALLTAGARPVLRDALAVDAAMWARGRGWALSTGVVHVAAYLESAPELTGSALRQVGEVLADFGHGG